ncbi:MAG: amino acid ABC transporter substrate-binding protein [Chloroflexi bacterium]|nr:amino acid ABC transporter substrate-binding protein [Chloroflexota bacterium]MDA8187038.1 amino acid ABC transporter substrate-binding protein [Dehalococcoidales bacterium]
MGSRIRFREWFFLLALLVMVGLMMEGCGLIGQQATGAGGNVVKIGAALSATGALAREGELMKRGYELWKDTVNEKGGIDVGGKKYKVDIIYYDDKGDATTAGKLVEKLITEDKVDFIMAPYSSGITAAASAISEKYQKIMIAPLANADSVYSRGFKYLFGVLYPVGEGFGLHIDYLNTLQPKVQKIAIIYPDDLYPTTAAEVVKKKAEGAGMRVVYFQKFPKGTQDLSALISGVKSSGAEALITSGYFEDNVLMVKTAKELKLNVKYLGGMGAPTQPDFVKTLGKNAEYVIGMSQWEPTSGWKGPFFGSSQDYNALYKKKYNEDATYYTAAASAGGLALQLALEKAGSVDTEKVRTALRALDVETFFTPIKFDDTGFNRSGKGLIVQIKDGKLNIVYPEKLAQSKGVFPMPEWDKR